MTNILADGVAHDTQGPCHRPGSVPPIRSGAARRPMRCRHLSDGRRRSRAGFALIARRRAAPAGAAYGGAMLAVCWFVGLPAVVATTGRGAAGWSARVHQANATPDEPRPRPVRRAGRIR